MAPVTRPAAQIRRITDSDLESFREMRLRALATDPLAFGDTLEGAENADLSVWKDWVQRSSSSDDAVTFLASVPEGGLVGMVGSTWKEGDTVLGAMWVEPRFRGLGVGRLLLDTVLAWSDSIHQGSKVRLYVAPTQPAAVQLYESRGFVKSGKDYPTELVRGRVFYEMVRTPKPIRT
jgi:ribosomal protein S18 acetylase RimI-like enzyme